MRNFWKEYWLLGKRIEEDMAEDLYKYLKDCADVSVYVLEEKLKQDWKSIENIPFPTFLPYIQNTLLKLLRNIYEIATEEIISLSPRVFKMRFGLDIKNPKVQEFIQTQSATMVKYINEETRQAIRTILLEAYEEGAHPFDMAKKIKNIIGLTPKYAQAVMRYRENLIQIGAKDVEKKVERYKEKLLKSRARTIARTETIRALSLGQYMAWDDLMKENVYKVDRIGVEWIATPDEITCDICMEIDGEIVAYGEEFIPGVKAPPLHPNCRCAIQLSDLPEEFRREPEEAIEPLFDIDISTSDFSEYLEQNVGIKLEDFVVRKRNERLEIFSNYLASRYTSFKPEEFKEVAGYLNFYTSHTDATVLSRLAYLLPRDRFGREAFLRLGPQNVVKLMKNMSQYFGKNIASMDDLYNTLAEYNKKIEDLISKLPRTKKTVYRGLSVKKDIWETIQKEGYLRPFGIQSFTDNKNIAQSFSVLREGDIQIVLEVSDPQMLPIWGFSEFLDEKEWVGSPSDMFQILSIEEKKENFFWLKVKQVRKKEGIMKEKSKKREVKKEKRGSKLKSNLHKRWAVEQELWIEYAYGQSSEAE